MTIPLDARFNFGRGRVTFYVLVTDDTQPLGCERIQLTEDLIQVVYDHDVVLDVGWYGESFEDESGCFYVKLIKNADWQRPLVKIPAHSVHGVIDVVNALVPAIPALTREFVRHPRLDKMYSHS